MIDHKFTDEEVIKALECCADTTQNSCKGCPCKSKGMRTGDVCIPAMSKAAAEFIKRQRAEIDALKIANEKMYAANKEQQAEIDSFLESVDELQADKADVTYFKKQFIANAKSEVAREIFEEIDKLHVHVSSIYDANRYDKLKKKYTGDQT